MTENNKHEPSREEIENAVAKYKMPWPERKAELEQKLCNPAIDPSNFTGYEALDYKMLLAEANGEPTGEIALIRQLIGVNEIVKAFGGGGILDAIKQANAQLSVGSRIDLPEPKA